MGFREPLWQQQPESDERLQPPIPPSATQKGGVPMIGDAWKRVGTGWTTTAVEGTTAMVAAITVRGKGKRRRTVTMVVATVVEGKGEQRIIRFIS